MSPGWQAGICGTAAVWFRQSVGGRHKWRPYVSRAAVWFRQSVGGRANRSTGVISGAPTSPGRRFINRRGDIHVARVADGNMRDRGGLFRQSSAGVSNRWRAYQTVYGRHKWRPCVSLGGGLSIVGATFMSPGWQAGICGNDGLKQVPEADRNTSSSNNPIKTKNHADSKIVKRCGNAGFRLWRVSGDSRGV